VRLGPAFLFCVTLCGVPDLAHMTLSPRSASASTFVELSVAELVAKSTLVVAGTPLDSKSLWEDTGAGRGRRIVTYTRVRIDRLIDGKVSGEVWVRTLGGQVDDIGQHVDGEAVLPSEKPSVLFLRALPDGAHAVVGMAQGNYPLETPADGPPRLMAPRGIGRLIGKSQPAPLSERQSDLPARLVLAGQTLDAAERLVLTERRLHAP
jgi:hypothetical protein